MSRSHGEREELVSRAFVSLADTLVDEFDIIDLLDRLVGFCVQLLPADAAGIVLGARVPVILTSRADSLLTRLASCAVAVMVAAARRKALSAAIS